MKAWVYTGLSVVIVVCILFLLPTPAPKLEGGNSFIFDNITYFDGQKWHEHTQLIVEKGRVVKTTKNDLPHVDMTGKFAIPGLIDAHTHAYGNALKQALRYGVSTELDMFTNVQYMQQEQATRDLLTNKDQADLFSAGTLVTSKGGHGTQFGMNIPTLDNPQDAQTFVAKRIDEGSDYIKIVYNKYAKQYHQAQPTRGTYTSINKESLIAVINAAKQQNKKVVVHVSNLASAVDVIDAGAHGLVHTFGDEVIDDDTLLKMKANNLFIIPTLSVIASFSQSSHSESLSQSKALATRMNQITRNQLLATFNTDNNMQNQLNIAIENTRLMHQAGIVILAGSDAPNPGTAHGASMHGELMLLVQSGLSIDEAIQAATFNAHQHFDIGQRGVLTPGALADILVLAKDPRVSIEHTQFIEEVYKNGFKHLGRTSLFD